MNRLADSKGNEREDRAECPRGAARTGERRREHEAQVAPPEEPIVINLNVKIEHEVRVKVDRDLEQLFTSEKGIF
mgnify:CR=1 FL=1